MKRGTFEPLQTYSGYLPIKDHGLIGDGATAALVGRDGAISWMCLPHFDSSAIFCSLLDVGRGGFSLMAPDGAVESRQYYETDTGVLVTEIRCQSGHVKITDALTLRSGADLSEDTFHGRSELVRIAEVLQGKVSLIVAIEPRGDASYERSAGGLMIKPKLHDIQSLHVLATTPLESPKTVVRLNQGERFYAAMRWDEGIGRYRFQSPEAVVDDTIRTWRKWVSDFSYEGPQQELVRRSAITLKLLDYTPTGAMVAAPTSSLPEEIGGTRNWDYRYAWVRDAAFSVYALRRIGLQRTAANFLAWVLDSIEKHGSPSVLYDLYGNQPPPERIDQDLEGYRKSAPVRWGNAAAEQRQHDVYGEIIDCAFQWARGGGEIDPPLWSRLRVLIESARSEWRTPDHGIWEVRTPGRPFTYSAALCHVALDRGVRLAEAFSFPAEVRLWRSEARRIKKAILEEAWDPDLHSLTEHLGKGGLDASLLSLPLRRVIPAVHPKMIATTDAISKRLGAGHGLLYRYLPDDFPDGVPGQEGAFVLCSFWLVDNLAKQGRLVEATDLFDSLCAKANSLGLLPEEIDPSSGAFLGNFPQAFSHVGLISSGVNLFRQGSMSNLDDVYPNLPADD